MHGTPANVATDSQGPGAGGEKAFIFVCSGQFEPGKKSGTLLLTRISYSQYPLYAASALAANSFARSSFAAAFPLFGVQLYESESTPP
ncbi:hypothetical protein LTR28_008722, partial [Elasticomyces elasticus]